MVVYAYAVVDPWTMMVKAFDTIVTYGAVTRSWGAEHFAVWTHLTGMYVDEHIHDLFIRLQVPRIH